MKFLLLIALAINVCLGEAEASGDVPHEPKGEPIDIDTLGKVGKILWAASPGQVSPLACGSVGTLNPGESVELETPHPYPNNFDCEWEVVFPAGAEVFLSCDYFWVKSGDYFYIGDQKYFLYSSGITGWQLELEEAAASLSLRFKSNSRRRAWGFRCYLDVEAGDFTTTTSPATTAATGTCTCGQANFDEHDHNRIVGGEETEEHEYPWQVGLVSASGSHPFCGGTLISSQHVLTAAHCTAGSSASSIAVLVGEHRIDDSSFTRASLSAITDHPDYNSATLDNDFSILSLAEPVAFSREVSPVCLPGDVSASFEGLKATVSGWGTTSSGGNQPTTLREVQVTVQSQEQCNSAYGGSITTNMICAADDGKDTCQGDSGGPMVVKENGRLALAGVTSWGYGCALPHYAGVYSRVTAQMDWILANSQGTQDTNQC